MYGQGNYPPQHGQGSHAPPPPFPQPPVTPQFQHRPPSVYSGPFQYQQQPPPPPAQHGQPIQNAPHSYHLPPGTSQTHVSNGATQSFPPQQNTLWGRDSQRPPPPPLAPLPLVPNRPEMFRPSIPFRGFAYTPQSSNQLPPPPPPPPTSSFFAPALMYPTGPSPPPPPSLPPASPPPAPPSPPPPIPPSAFGTSTSTTLDAVSELPQILKPDLTSETVGLDSADKVASTSKIMVDTTMAVDSNDLTDRASAEVGSPALKDLDSGEYGDLDLPPPPPKPIEETVVKKIEDLCHSIAINGLGFECITRQKESGNPEFRFLFAGEVGSEAAVAHEYFKWVRKKCLLQRKKSNVAPKLPNISSLTRTSTGEAEVSPTVSDMEMEDDFIQPDEMHFESVSSPEDCGYREQLCAPKDDVERSPSKDDVSRFSHLGEEEQATGSIFLHQNDQPMHGKAFIGVDSLNASPYRAAKPMENSNIGVYSLSSEDDLTPIKSADEFKKSPSPIRLLQDYASDDSSQHDNKPPLDDVVPNTEGPVNLPSPELAFEKSPEPVGPRSLPSSPSKDQELLLKSQSTAAEANLASTDAVNAEFCFEGSNKYKEFNKSVVSPEVMGGKEVLQVVEEAAPGERNAKFQKVDVQDTSTHQKVDEFGRMVRDVASDSDSDDSYRIHSHGKRGRSRSRSPRDRRRSRWSPRRRRERRSRSPSWSPRKRRSRSRSPSYRRGGESGVETVKRDKCFDFLRGRCYRGASCRFMHQETDKNAGARYNRNTRTFDRHVATEKSPPRRSIHQHDLPGSSAVYVKNEDQNDKLPVADFCKSERLSGTDAIVLGSTEMKEEISESTIKLCGVEHCQEKEETEDPVIDRSQANTSIPVITSTTGEDRIEMSKPDLNTTASIDPNQGAHLELPAAPLSLPQTTSIPPRHPYQAQSQMQPLHYPTPPNTWPLPPPPPLPTTLQQQFTNNFTAPAFQQNQFPARNDYRMFQQHSYTTPSQTEDLRSKPVNQVYGGMGLHPGHLSSFPPPSLGHSATYMQQPHYSLQLPSSDGHRFGAYTNINPPYEGSQMTHHYNPYASTFDQPFEPKIDSNAELPKSGSDKYDPLFDSIEPPSSSAKKIDEGQGLESALRLSSSREPLDVGESYKQKEVEFAAVSTPTKSNGEFGETADAEVAEVESGKSSNPHHGGPTALGEIEIEQVKDKKSKDSRSMKLFKSSIAEYVKEVLKPHWRQGGMSKEAFKIIVKKTIDKVCGATKSHHIPKSQEKINRYIDSSERKLNKLVMGYVDKYAKL